MLEGSAWCTTQVGRCAKDRGRVGWARRGTNLVQNAGSSYKDMWMKDEAGEIIKQASKTRKGGGEERGKRPDSTIGGKWVDCWS